MSMDHVGRVMGIAVSEKRSERERMQENYLCSPSSYLFS